MMAAALAEKPPPLEVLFELASLREVALRVPTCKQHAHSASQLRAVLRRVDPACEPLRSQDGSNFPVLSIHQYQELLPRLHALAREGVFDFKLLPAIPLQAHTHMPALVPDGDVERAFASIPSELRRTLLQFQVDGVKFALRRQGRVLFADEMGVGKTLQAIALAAALDAFPLLIVVPASLRLAWAEELERWLPHLRPQDIQVIFTQKDVLPTGERPPQVTVTSFAMLRIVKSSLVQRRWAMLIVDESHNLRYSRASSKQDAAQVEACIDLLRHVPHVALLSGTPSLCRPFDLYAQVHVIRPSLFGTSRFQYGHTYCRSRYERILMEQYGNTEGHLRLSDRFRGGARLQELHTLLTETVMIRRLKRDVLNELPEKRRQVIRLELTPDDHRELKRVASLAAGGDDEDGDACEATELQDRVGLDGVSARATDVAHLGRPDDLGDYETDLNPQPDHMNVEGAQYQSTLRGLLPKSSYQALGIAKLRAVTAWLDEFILKACVDREQGSPPGIYGALDRGQITQDTGDDESLLAASANPEDETKTTATVDGAQQAEEEGKVVIFGHHRSVLNGIQAHLEHKGCAGLVRIDGGTVAQERAASVNRFHRSPACRVALVSITAGGVGLDLSAASTVVFAEMPMSSSDLVQAEDRAHRRGQKSSVNAYFLIARGTQEEEVWQGLSKQLACLSELHDGADKAQVGLTVHSVKETSAVHLIDLKKRKRRLAAGGTGANPDANHDLDDDVQMTQALVHKAAAEGLLPVRGRRERDDVGHEDELEEDPDYAPDVGACDGPEYRLRNEMDRKEAEELYDRLLGTRADASSMNIGLWFEVSPHTGRIHLHASDNGSEHLHGSFLPEQLFNAVQLNEQAQRDALRTLGEDCKPVVEGMNDHCEKLPSPLDTSAGARLSALRFLKEWTALSAMRKNLLIRNGKPVRSPLDVEAKAIAKLKKESTTPGSTRRYTPRGEEAGEEIPEGSKWETVWVGVPRGNSNMLFRYEMERAVDSGGHPLCRQCMKQLAVSPAAEPAQRGAAKRGRGEHCFKRFELFCSQQCFELYGARSSGSSLRKQLFEVEKGICALCSLDCHTLGEKLRSVGRQQRAQLLRANAPAFAGAVFARAVSNPSAGNLWHADHVLAVKDGGGECSVANLRTLCVPCHAIVTKQQRTRWAQERGQKTNEARAAPARDGNIEQYLERFRAGHQRGKASKRGRRAQAAPRAQRHLVVLGDSSSSGEEVEVVVDVAPAPSNAGRQATAPAHTSAAASPKESHGRARDRRHARGMSTSGRAPAKCTLRQQIELQLLSPSSGDEDDLGDTWARPVSAAADVDLVADSDDESAPAPC